LGFTLFKQDNQLHYKLGSGAWDGLKKGLLRAHESVNPSATAMAVLVGWIDSHGPAFRRRQNRSVSYILRLVCDYGFRECFRHDYYEEMCVRAWQKWRSLIRQVHLPV